MPAEIDNLNFVENPVLDLAPHPQFGMKQDVAACTTYPQAERMTQISTHGMRGGICIGVSYRVPGAIGGIMQFMADMPNELTPNQVIEYLEEAGNRCDEQHGTRISQFFGG